jgi:hypothetical protein
VDPIKRRITTWLYRLILESPKAHVRLLQIYYSAEAFHHRFPWFRKPELVDDAPLQLLMKQHFADEDNHAKYFRLALTLKGDPVVGPPLDCDYLVQLAAAFWDGGILIGETIEDLTGDELFTNPQNLFVQLAFKDLSEKRAIHEFHIWRDLAKTREPEIHAILKRVVEDEDWHVHIFHTEVQKRLADPERGPHFRAVYKRLLKTNARIANRVGANFLNHVLDHGLLEGKPWELRAVRLVAWFQGLGTGDLSLARAESLRSMETDVYGGAPATAMAAS